MRVRTLAKQATGHGPVIAWATENERKEAGEWVELGPGGYLTSFDVVFVPTIYEQHVDALLGKDYPSQI